MPTRRFGIVGHNAEQPEQLIITSSCLSYCSRHERALVSPLLHRQREMSQTRWNGPTKEGWGSSDEIGSGGEPVQFNATTNEGDIMKKFLATITGVAMLAAFTPLASAQSAACPPEVARAKAMLSQKSTQAPRTLAGSRSQQDPQAPRGQDIQAPRSLAGARSQQEPQAARGENPQAARGENPQAARGENPQAARGENPQAARGENPQAARGENPQAARGENPQAARGENPQAPRGQDVQTARAGSAAKPSGDINKASGLIKEAEAACKAGDVKSAKEKADAAISILK
jgi:hypothetical protein